MRISAWTLGLVLAGALACGGSDEPEPIRFSGEEVDQARSSWPPAVAAAVDSGNAAYRAGRLEAARDHFNRAIEASPHTGAAWFGLYMAEHGLGNLAAADTALARATELTPSLPRRPLPSDTSSAADTMGPHR